MTQQLRADPGVGSEAAPIGTEKWAQRVRYSMQRIVKTLEDEPERFDGYRKLCFDHRAWTLMNRPDGSFFASWEEYCEHEEPWGLGHRWEELRPILEVAMGKKAVQLATLAPSAQGSRTDLEDTSPHDEGKSVPHATVERLRAVDRAPHVVKDLFREDLIGVTEAAKLGPKNPSPEEAAKVTEVAIAAEVVAKADPKPTTPRAKRERQRKVNAVVREKLDMNPEPAAVLFAAVRKLTPDERRALFGQLVTTYPNEIGWAR